MDILQNLLSQVLDDNTIKSMSKELNADESQIKTASAMLLPTLFESLNSNAKDEKGAASLLGALDDHANVDVSNINNFFSNVDLGDGEKILGHIFKNKEREVESEVAKKSGLSKTTTKTLMSMLAPLLLGYLANQKKNSNNFDAGALIGMLTSNIDMGSLLGGLFGSKSSTTTKSTNKKVTKVESKDNSDLLGNISDILGGILGSKK